MADALKRSLGIPMGDLSQFKKRPVATLAIIVINIAVYAITSYEKIFLEVSDYWVSAGGFVPALTPMPTQWYRIFSSMFLHADFFHILFNMYFLYIFGRAVEEALGRWRFLALYMVSGIVASIFHTAFSFLGGATAYVIPAIGASGAISGVLGAYLILFPGTSLVMGWFFLYFPMFFRLKAAYYLLFWFATQVIYGYFRLSGSTAVFAHAGGFIAGIALLPLVASKEKLTQFKLARQTAFPTYIVFTPAPVKPAGLGQTTKIIIAVLLVALLLGTAYASTGLASHDNAKWVTVQYTCNGIAYTDSVGISLYSIESQITSISASETRILFYRLNAAHLLYNADRADDEVSIRNWSGELPVNVTVNSFTITVNVSTAIIDFVGKYDSDGFLNYGNGSLITRAVRGYVSGGILHITKSDPITYKFELNSKTMNLASITQCAGLPSLITTTMALFVAVTKDKELALIGEEPRRVWHPYTPVV
ncbi:MAG: rhomboid family intramembrane serine protease [Candidatus Bathyarchaeia archaeon]